MSGVPGAMALPLHVESHGSGPPILLLHGFGGSSFTFRHWVESLARDHEVILVDMKGFGSAPKPDDERYDPHELANLIHRLVLQRDLRNLTLVGHSLGGGVALLVALLLLDRGELDRLRALVSVAGAAYGLRIPTFIGLVRRRWTAGLALRLVPSRWLIRTVLRSIVYDPEGVRPDQVESYAEPLGSRAGRRALLRTAAQIVPPDLAEITARFGELDVPALLLWGRSDPVIPVELGERLARELPRARLEILEECGHIPPEERPWESLAVLRKFLEEC